MIVPFDVDQSGWGSMKVYPDGNLDPDWIALHWGGSTSQIVGTAEEEARLRSWQRYHIQSRGWRDIAYNYAVGDSGTIYRCRGLNPGGHTSTRDDIDPNGVPYNVSSIGVVWIGGANANGGTPSAAAFASIAKIIDSTGLPVKGHRTIKVEGGSWTACPGDEILRWIDNYVPGEGDDEMEALRLHVLQLIEAAFDSGNPNIRPQGEEGVRYWTAIVNDPDRGPLDPELLDLWKAGYRPTPPKN